MYFRHLYALSDEGSRCILSEFGLLKSSSADCQQLHTVSATCSNTVTFFIFRAHSVSICLVLIISRCYERLTLYSLEYD